MEIKYELKNSIGVLSTPQEIDLSANDKICFTFFAENGIMEVNKIGKYEIINGKCEIKVRDLVKGTNTIRVIVGKTIIPCQPINLHDVGNKLQCTLATSLDTLKLISDLQDKYILLEARLKAVEKTNPQDIFEKVNALISLTEDMQIRLNELEAGYDPTLI